jgi:hypothetical protein
MQVIEITAHQSWHNSRFLRGHIVYKKRRIAMKPKTSPGPSGADHLHVLYTREFTGPDGEPRSAFTRVGVAFPLRNQPGFKLRLDAMPFHGELLVLPANDGKDGTS